MKPHTEMIDLTNKTIEALCFECIKKETLATKDNNIKRNEVQQ
jgi:hypothetical protein